MKRYILLLLAVAFTSMMTHAQETSISDATTSVVAVDSVAVAADTATVEKRDKSSRFLPTSRRIDRHVDRNKFVYKGEVMLGLAASHGKLSVEDSELMLLVDDINIGLNSTTVKPFLAFAYRDNRSVGMRFGYEYIRGDLGNIALNLGSAADLSFSLSDLGLKSENFSWSLFHRNYIGLDRRGIVGAIIESELMVKTGTMNFYTADDEGVAQSSLSRNFAARLNFNPGLAVYVFPQVCVTVTVGIGGLYYNNVRLMDANDEVVGRRDRTGLKFKFNIADIQIGIVAHLWNKNKK